ncbi:ATP10 protein-domain-containing protein [Lipomyces arxii]|uniref:ATP10 protein-domain-containing protein n=1 Tax=Lipomyces arxii TaxID=56418 RepID=UPI0034CF4904
MTPIWRYASVRVLLSTAKASHVLTVHPVGFQRCLSDVAASSDSTTSPPAFNPPAPPQPQPVNVQPIPPTTQLPTPEKKKASSDDVAKALKALNLASKPKQDPGAYLIRPIGVKTPPKAIDNTGGDKRTWAQKRADFVDYDKHIERRKELLAQMSKSYFSEMHEYIRTMGKQWTAPKLYFKADKALYLPNFIGTTVKSSKLSATTTALKGHVSIVKIYSALSGERQIQSYFDNPDDAWKPVPVEKGYQIVDIYIPESFIKSWISKIFQGRTRKLIGQERYDKFFYATKLPGQLNLSIGLTNRYCGYIYLVDRDCKIRWAACGDAIDEERDSLKRCLEGMVSEDRARQKK